MSPEYLKSVVPAEMFDASLGAVLVGVGTVMSGEVVKKAIVKTIGQALVKSGGIGLVFSGGDIALMGGRLADMLITANKVMDMVCTCP